MERIYDREALHEVFRHGIDGKVPRHSPASLPPWSVLRTRDGSRWRNGAGSSRSHSSKKGVSTTPERGGEFIRPSCDGGGTTKAEEAGSAGTSPRRKSDVYLGSAMWRRRLTEVEKEKVL